MDCLSSGILNNRYESKQCNNLNKQVRVSTYCGLKERWWKQIIDGYVHTLGHMVFDGGYHEAGVAEPGYYKSVKNACEFACSHLLEVPNVNFYKQLHKIACAHFDAKSTLITADKTGIFNPGERCVGPLKILFRTQPDAEIAKVDDQVEMSHQIGIANLQLLYSTDRNEVLRRLFLDEGTYEQGVKSKEEFDKIVDDKIKKINTYIAEQSKLLGSTHPVAVLRLSACRKYVSIRYLCTATEAETMVSNLFNLYNERISRAETEDQKIDCIAYIYEMLEWIHPFHDGQGRTDLVLLSKLLTENGINPSILDYPYVSSFNLFGEWKEYLKNGIEAWRKESRETDFYEGSKPLFVEE